MSGSDAAGPAANPLVPKKLISTMTEEEKSKLSKDERRVLYEYERKQNAGLAKSPKSTRAKKETAQQQSKKDRARVDEARKSTLNAAAASTASSTSKSITTTLSGGGGASGSSAKQSKAKPQPTPSVILQDINKKSKPTEKEVQFVSHLQSFRRPLATLSQADMGLSASDIHPAIVSLGLKYATGSIVGSNARCIALLSAFRRVFEDYETPPKTQLRHDLGDSIKPYIKHLAQCRQISVSMGNAIKFLKQKIASISPEISDTEAKEILGEAIDQFVYERIELADQAIAKYAQTKIRRGDTILVFACSSCVLETLLYTHSKGVPFEVVVMDSRPKMEGVETLRRLIAAGIACKYVLIGAASYIMKGVTSVILGAHAMLANGCVMSRVGTSVVAMMAKANNVPVMVCCERYKFCERSQTDPFVFNELGDPDDIARVDTHHHKSLLLSGAAAALTKDACSASNAKGSSSSSSAPSAAASTSAAAAATAAPASATAVAGGRLNTGALADWRNMPGLRMLNIMYDVTPPHFVDMVITEVGMIPCTSVPVVLREFAEM